MKVALLFFSILMSLSIWCAAQDTPRVVCHGKLLSINMLPGPKMTGPSLPLRFGGTRPVPGPPVNGFYSEKGKRFIIKNRDEFNDFWKQFTARIPSENGMPPLPEIDFSKDMVIITAMGMRPTSGYWTIIDGACETGGKVEVFITTVEDTSCMGVFDSVTYPADAVRIPQTDLPIVFRETNISCKEWIKKFERASMLPN